MAFNVYWQAPQHSDESMQSITDALSAELDPRTTNDIRQQAREYLVSIKQHFDAPHYGFVLAEDPNHNEAVRYYGLQLLEHAIRYKWETYGRTQTDQILRWVQCLAGSIRAVDKSFIRNKIAQLWADAAKRSWAGEWMEQDKQLVALWERPKKDKGFSAKMFVLYVLETLSEDIMEGEDTLAGLRSDELKSALNDVMVPLPLYQEFQQTRKERMDVRFGDDGWVSRMCALFAWCLREIKTSPDRAYTDKALECAIKTLHALRPTMQWINLKGPVEVNMVSCFSLVFQMYDPELQTAAAELMYTLLRRPYAQHAHDAWTTIVKQALQPDTIGLIKSRFESIHIAPGEDEKKYLLQKKLSELIAVLTDAIILHPELAIGNVDQPMLFELLQNVLQSKSLIVSIPVLDSWSKLLPGNDPRIRDQVLQALGVLMQTCGSRLLRYESVSEADAENDEIIQFLNEDFDTVPERHAFIGAYQKHCANVITKIARDRPKEVLEYVFGQMQSMLETGPYTFGRGFDSAAFGKSQLSGLHFDAQFRVAQAALKGYSKWLEDVGTIGPESEAHAQAQSDVTDTVNKLQQWSYGVMDMHIDNPDVAALLLTTLAKILKAVKPKADPAWMLRIVQHLLTMQLYDNAAHTTFSDAVKNFESLRVVELQKLALEFPDHLHDVYHELEPRIDVSVQKHSSDPRLAWGYRAFLFIIVHRTSALGSGTKQQRLKEMLKPVYDAWVRTDHDGSLRSLENFCASLDLGNLQEFYMQHRFTEVADWSSQQLDEAGQARQTSIKAKTDALPLRMTKTMLTATVEHLYPGTQEYSIAAVLWGELIQIILPALVSMIHHAQAFHNMDNWSHLSPEVQAVFKRTFQDRFWQSGISNESKEEFYARISGSKTSYEGFASVVRGTMRNVREQGLHVIYLLTKFGEDFYGFAGLAEPLANALFEDAGCLSANSLNQVLDLIRGIVFYCPPQERDTFLPPLLKAVLVKVDAKITAEWEAVNRANEAIEQGDELSDEMRSESILRTLTYSMVLFVIFLIEFDSTPKTPSDQLNGDSRPLAKDRIPGISKLVFSDLTILEPLVLFCTNVLRIRDARCCISIIKAIRYMLPLFGPASGIKGASGPEVREFVSTDMLKACITSLNEPYFAEIQKDFAALIAQILYLYCPLTPTPRSVLLSLPNMSSDKVDRALERIYSPKNEREQRSVVLKLLEGVKAVSIHEAGKIEREPPKKKAGAPQEKYMEVEQMPARVVEGEEVGLDGVAGMFGDA